jgi:hypothetical protein
MFSEPVIIADALNEKRSHIAEKSLAGYSATWLPMARESHRRWLVQP